jgi:hypothetical protein
MWRAATGAAAINSASGTNEAAARTISVLSMIEAIAKCATINICAASMTFALKRFSLVLCALVCGPVKRLPARRIAVVASVVPNAIEVAISKYRNSDGSDSSAMSCKVVRVDL